MIPDGRAVLFDKSLQVCAGLDASTVSDQTALFVTGWHKLYKKVGIVWHKIWQPSHDRPMSFEHDIEGAIYDLRQRYNIS